MTSRTIKSYECESSSLTLLASSHFDHIPFIPSFYALVSTLKHCMSRNCLTCGYWEVVDEVEPIVLYIKPLGVTSMLCLYCHAMLVDVDWVLSVFMTDVRLLIIGST